MVPALVPVVLAQMRVLAQRPREAPPLAPAQLPVPALPQREPEQVALGQALVRAELAVAERLLSLQSFSAAMAGSTPKQRATYERVPRSR